MTRIIPAFLLAAALPGLAQAQTPDTTALFAAARKAEIDAEEAIRKHAEFKPGPPYNGQECDENIANWCIYYEPAGVELPKEPAKVDKARDEAIVALQKAFDVAPGRTATVFPLVRLLVKDGRTEDALTVATAHLAAQESSEAHMVLGYALHHARRTEDAMLEFEKWLTTAPKLMREKAADIAWLVPPGMAPRYLMSVPKLWNYADALYITPGNETLTDHYSRHAYNQMMAAGRAGPVAESWSVAEDQMIIRFGPDVVVTRSFLGSSRAGPPGNTKQMPGRPQGEQMGVNSMFLGHWDNTAHTYFPPDFERVVQMRAPVDTLWPTDTLVGRSGHAPPTIRFMRSLQHQAVVFPGPNTLVVAGGTKTDKLSAGKPLTGRLFVLDATLNVLAETNANVKNLGDSLVFVAEMKVPPQARFFSAEVYDGETRFAARARYRIEPPAASGGMALSGIMITNPYRAGQLPSSRTDASAAPLSRPVVTPGQTLGIYSELTIPGDAVRSINLELEIRSIDKPSTVTRMAGWVGAKLGFAGNATPGKLGWTLEVQPKQNNAIALTIEPGQLDGGRYLITLKATDPTTGAVVLAEREFLTR